MDNSFYGYRLAEDGLSVLDSQGESHTLRRKSLLVFQQLAKTDGGALTKQQLIDAVWPDVEVTDDSLIQCIAEIRRVLGDADKQSLQTIPRYGYRLVPDTVTDKSRDKLVDSNAGSSGRTSANSRHEELSNNQKIRFCLTKDGVRIAYSTLGEGTPIIFVANWLTHLRFDLRSPTRLAMVESLTPDFTLIRYDARGNGLSDLEVEDLSLEASILDLEAIVDDLGCDKVSLIGQSQGAAIAAAYAARNTDKVQKLVVLGGYARGRRKRGSKGQIAESEAFVTMIREGWGRNIDAYVQMFGTFFMPDANQEQLAGFTNFQRIATPPENAARIQEAIDDFDILNELSSICAPCLVLHVREDARVSFEEGLKMAAAIPNAQFVPLEGRNHILLAGEPALEQFIARIGIFLRS